MATKRHSDFVHLHVHTQYSLLDGACRLQDLISLAADMRMPACAITDHGNLFGMIEFYQKAQDKGVKPILGSEVYIAPVSRFEKSSHGIQEASFHLILLAKDEIGYKNLMKLVSIGYTEGFYYRPRIDKEVLARYNDGLIGFSACLAGEIPHLILSGESDAAKRTADQYRHIFGSGNFYLELQDSVAAYVRGKRMKRSTDGRSDVKFIGNIPSEAAIPLNFVFVFYFNCYFFLFSNRDGG